MTLDTLKGTYSGKNTVTIDGKEEEQSKQHCLKKKYPSEWISGHVPRKFSSAREAYEFLYLSCIRPQHKSKQYILHAECVYGRDVHDALDYMMYEHGYKVIYV